MRHAIPARGPARPDRAAAASPPARASPQRRPSAPNPRFSALALQTKLDVGPTDDPLEREADRVADVVMRDDDATVRRMCAGCAEEERATVRRQPIEDEEPDALVQRDMVGGPAGGALTPGLARQVQATRRGGEPLSPSVRAVFEPRLARDLGDVRIHRDPAAADTASALSARAYTIGADIAFARGQYQPRTPAGRRLLAHELVHTVQQTGGAEANSGPPIHRSPEPKIQRELCEDPAEIARGGLPRLLQARGLVASEIPQVLAQQLTFEQFQAMTGMSAGDLPESTFVGMDRIQPSGLTQGPPAPPDVGDIAGPAAGMAGLRAPAPISFAPDNCVGILGTRPHLSIFAKVDGRLTVVGFRGNLFTHIGSMLPGEAGLWFRQQLVEGVPGAMRGDRLFALMGEQAVIFRETDATTARNFASHLRQVEYGGTYRFTPPDPNAARRTERTLAERVYQARGETKASMCTARNCITVPIREVHAVLGTSPSAGGVDLASGRTTSGQYRPHEHGRARLMWEYMQRPDLSQGRPGLQSVTVTPGAARAIGAIRVGGVVMLLYGGYETGTRLHEAWGTEAFPLVAAQEALTWTGNIAGTAVGAAAASALVCSPGGPVTLVCAVGGFLGGLVVGTIGGAIGSLIIPVTLRMVEGIIEAVVLLVEGFAAAGEIARGFTQGFGEMLLTGLLEVRYSLNPCNWELQGLSPLQQRDIWALGFYLWTKFGPANADTLLGMLDRPLSNFAVPRDLLGQIAAGMTQAVRARTGEDVLFTPEVVGGMTPLELVRQLRAYGLLQFKYDPRLLAEIATLPEE